MGPRPALWLFLIPSLFAQTGIVTTIAGSGSRGYGGDGAHSSQSVLSLANLQNQCDPAQFEQRAHLFVDSNRAVYIADSENQRIRRISREGIIDTVAGSGGRPETNSRCEPTSPIGDGGQARSARLYNPSDVAIHPDGSMIIADQQNNRIRRIALDGVITTIAGSGLHNLYAPGIPAINSPMDWPSSLAIDANGLVYFTEIHGNRVGRIGADGRLATIAGSGLPGYNGDNISATSAQLRKPAGIAFDSAGNLYIADMGNHRVRKVTPGGVISTIAGTGVAAFSGDGGPATSAALNTPLDVKVDGKGNVFIADTVNNRVRRIDGSGNVASVTGTWNHPSGLAVDRDDNLYVVDWQNYLVHKVTFTFPVDTIIDRVVNGASFAPLAAPGSLISIFALNPTVEPAQATTFPWPEQLGGITAKLNDAPLPLVAVSSTQIAAQIPIETPVGMADVVVGSPAGVSRPAKLNVVASAIGIFTFQDSQRAIAINPNGTINLPDNPAKLGSSVTVFLTGAGPSPTPIAATVGGADAEVRYLNAEPGSAAIAQASVRIPDSAAVGPDVPLVLTVGGNPSNVVTISVR